MYRAWSGTWITPFMGMTWNPALSEHALEPGMVGYLDHPVHRHDLEAGPIRACTRTRHGRVPGSPSSSA
jgi:hypothetical protein